MKITVLNGSPKGKYSITLQYLNLLEKKYARHEFKVLHISQKIKIIEKDAKYFQEIIDEILNQPWNNKIKKHTGASSLRHMKKNKHMLQERN